MDQRDQLTAEKALRYDSPHALSISRQMNAELAECKDPYPLSRFFEGGLAKGKKCERDAQCESFVCAASSGDQDAAKLCAANGDVPLCDPADS
jgi:hypothetical protein